MKTKALNKYLLYGFNRFLRRFWLGVLDTQSFALHNPTLHLEFICDLLELPKP